MLLALCTGGELPMEAWRCRMLNRIFHHEEHEEHEGVKACSALFPIQDFIVFMVSALQLVRR
jgi:hypothetical protein